MENLLQNKLFLQYLSGAGAAVAQGDSPAGALNAITQQNIGAQSQAGLIDLFRKMLAGGVPGGKAVMSDKGLNLTVPPEALTPKAGGEGSMGGISMSDLQPAALTSNQPTGAGVSNLPTGQQGNYFSNLLNPSVSQPDISPSDLAGLSAQDVSSALSGAIGIENLNQSSILNQVRMMKALEKDPLDVIYPIPHAETGEMTTRQWNELPASEKEFSAYVQTARKIGAPKEELTRKFFSTLEPTEREQFARAAMEDPELMSAAKELAKSGATRISIGEKMAEKKETIKLSGQEFFGGGKHIAGLQKHLSSEDIQNKVFMSETPSQIRSEETAKYIESEIVGRRGKIIDRRIENNMMIWTVKWPSGDTEEIKHAVNG